MEIIQDVRLENHYLVSNKGDVWSIRKGIFMKQFTSSGYNRVDLRGKKYLVHRLVAKTYLPIVSGKEYVNHKDGNKQNNHVSNLEWCTMSENIKHAFATGLKVYSGGVTRGEDSPKSVVNNSIVFAIRDEKELSNQEIADKYRLSKSAIKHILKGRSWKHLLPDNFKATNKINKRINLSLLKAREIRAKSCCGYKNIDIAKEYNITPAHVSKVINNSIWKDS